MGGWSGGFFEEALQEAQEAQVKEEKNAEVMRIFRETSGMVSKSFPSASRSYEDDVSLPDSGEVNSYFNDETTSHGLEYYRSTATSFPGPDFRKEKLVEESRWTSQRADKIESDCVDAMKMRAETQCVRRELPNGKTDENMSPEDCLRFWAEGMADDTTSDVASRVNNDTTKHALKGGLELPVPGVGKAGYKATAESSTTDAAAHSKISSQTVKGSDGYLAQCNRTGSDWFNQRMMALLPYSD